MEIINLYGASGHGKVIKDIIESAGKQVGVFYDDFSTLSEIQSIPIRKTAEGPVSGPIIISIGANNIRKRIAESLVAVFATAIHLSAIVSKSATIGEGTVVMPGAIIQSETQIGRHCIINTGASVDHECRIADYVHISPHATLCGNVIVGEGSWIGAGSTVIPGVKIGRWCVVGAGATVVNDIPDNTTVVGIPAKPIKEKTE